MNHQSPTIFVIFGITGDLAGKKLLPALIGLYSKKMLPRQFSVIGVARRPFSKDDFRQFIRSHIKVVPGEFREEDIKHFIDHVEYEQGNFDTQELYENIKSRISSIEKRFGQCPNKLFHLSVPPILYENILNRLAESEVHKKCSDDLGWTRVLVEKPFGNDIVTASRLDKLLGSLFDENQIFRIDHYLAKESLQNILAFRFSNSLFEPLWNKDYIDQVHVMLLEKDDIRGRANFYDKIGALKDVGQNHVLQMLALIAMDEPKDFTAESIRKERAKILKNIEIDDSKDSRPSCIRGQYRGYDTENSLPFTSSTETYFLIRSRINSARWKGVPFYLESGKALKESKVEIRIYFKNQNEIDKQNILVFRIQPDEGIKLRFWVKTPGFPMSVEPKTLSFKYTSFSRQDMPDDYEKLIYDAVYGDQTLFTSTEEVMSAWKFITRVIDSWGHLPLQTYEKGSNGPIN